MKVVITVSKVAAVFLPLLKRWKPPIILEVIDYQHLK